MCISNEKYKKKKKKKELGGFCSLQRAAGYSTARQK